MKEKSAEKQYQVLEKYCQNITQQAKDGKLDPVIGREGGCEELAKLLENAKTNLIKNLYMLLSRGQTPFLPEIAKLIAEFRYNGKLVMEILLNS